jgi:large subunit ribosomal protein L17
LFEEIEMRHSRVINHLGRTSSHRKSMLANMATSLILHKRITTTTAKAKALKTYVEPLITKSKEDSTHSRRVVFSYLKDKTAVSELFREISPKVADRPGGYTRILKIGNRQGDNAEMCIVELVDYNEAMLGGDTKTKTTRRRRSTKKKGEVEGAVVTKTVAAAPKVEEPAEEKTQDPEKETTDNQEEK